MAPICTWAVEFEGVKKSATLFLCVSWEAPKIHINKKKAIIAVIMSASAIFQPPP